MMTSSDDITIERFESDKASEWKSFLGSSNNGTLFHDLDFLSYHPEGRFDTHHLMFYRDGKLIAVLPAAVVTDPDGRRFLKSPYGASVGGIVLPPHMSTRSILDIVGKLQEYIRTLGLDGIEMRLGPFIYMRHFSQSLEFALAVRKFVLNARWLCFIKPLEDYEQSGGLFSERKRRYVRSRLREGMFPREADVSGLDAFYALLMETMERLNARPTHQKEELELLFKLVPGRLRLFLCRHRDVEIAGALVFMLNEFAAYTFHIVGKNESQGNTVLTQHVISQMANEGIKYLDMGPSASTYHFNEGVVRFKELIGTQGFCRDEWRWECK